MAVAAGTAYVDVGTLGGYREAMRLLTGKGTRAQTVLGAAKAARGGRRP